MDGQIRHYIPTNAKRFIIDAKSPQGVLAREHLLGAVNNFIAAITFIKEKCPGNEVDAKI